MLDTRFRDTELSLMCRPYTLWMVQRPLDAYAALAATERARVDAALAGTGWEALLACRPKHRLGKRGNLLGRMAGRMGRRQSLAKLPADVEAERPDRRVVADIGTAEGIVPATLGAAHPHLQIIGVDLHGESLTLRS
mgnify:CR=1 FL=1